MSTQQRYNIEHTPKIKLKQRQYKVTNQLKTRIRNMLKRDNYRDRVTLTGGLFNDSDTKEEELVNVSTPEEQETVDLDLQVLFATQTTTIKLRGLTTFGDVLDYMKRMATIEKDTTRLGAEIYAVSFQYKFHGLREGRETQKSLTFGRGSATYIVNMMETYIVDLLPRFKSSNDTIDMDKMFREDAVDDEEESYYDEERLAECTAEPGTAEADKCLLLCTKVIKPILMTFAVELGSGSEREFYLIKAETQEWFKVSFPNTSKNCLLRCYAMYTKQEYIPMYKHYLGKYKRFLERQGLTIEQIEQTTNNVIVADEDDDDAADAEEEEEEEEMTTDEILATTPTTTSTTTDIILTFNEWFRSVINNKICFSQPGQINHRPNKFNIYVVGVHAGYLEFVPRTSRGIKPKNEAIEKLFPNEWCGVDKADTLLFTYDFEWTWRDLYKGKVLGAEDPAIGVCVSYYMPTGEKNTIWMKSFKPNYGPVETVEQQTLEFMRDEKKRYRNPPNIFAFSHNGKNVEHLLLTKEIMRTAKTTKSFANVNGTSIKSFSHKGIKFIDSMLLYTDSLDKFTKDMTNASKLDIVTAMKEIQAIPQDMSTEAFYLTHKWGVGSYEIQLIEYAYCERDCTALLESILAFNEKLREVWVKALAAVKRAPKAHSLFHHPKAFLLGRSSLACIAQQLLTSCYQISVTPTLFDNILRDCYIGGRTECFMLGKFRESKDEALYETDICSSYPAQMCGFMANTLLAVYQQPTRDTLNRVLAKIASGETRDTRRYLFTATVKHTPNQYQVPKLATRDGDRICFKTGEFLAHFWDFELDPSITLLHVSTMYIFDTISFKDLLELLYKYRQDVGKNSPTGLVIKLLMNSMYGRFAMQDRRKTIHYFKDLNAFRLKNNIAIGMKWLETEQDDIGFGLLHKLVVTGLSFPDVNIGLAACITAAGRQQLWQKICDIKRGGGTPLYSDTDSVYYKWPRSALPPVMGVKTLGAWDTEGLKALYIKGLKRYKKIGLNGVEHIKYKGVSNPKDLTEDTSGYQWIRSFNCIYMLLTEKHAKDVYSKGVVTQVARNQWTITPFICGRPV